MPSTIAELYAAHTIEIIAAATIAAGPGATPHEVAERVGIILELARDGSPASAAADRVAWRDSQITETKRFTGTIIHLDIETTAHRAVVVLHTGKTAPGVVDGQEIVRTAQLDGADFDSATARDIGRRIQGTDGAPGLIGHKVLVTVWMEKGKNGFEYRVLAGVEDQGVDAAYDAQLPAYTLSRNLKVRFSSWQHAAGFGYADNK